MLALVPHQDDELLIMGAALRNAIASGRGVQLVLFGLGDGTIVRTRDMPRLLGYEPTGAEIGAVRDREFTACAERLGLSASAVAMAEPRQHEKVNRDHATMGRVVRDLWAEGEIALPPRAFVAPWLRASVDEPALEAETAQIGYWEQAPYRFTDIHAGAWGVGLKSVRDYFDAQLSDPTTWSYSLERARRRA